MPASDGGLATQGAVWEVRGALNGNTSRRVAGVVDGKRSFDGD